MNDDSKLQEICKVKFSNGVPLDGILRWLRKETGMRTRSIKIVSELLEIPIGEAKTIVVLSPVWADSLESQINVEAKVEQEPLDDG